MLVQLQYIRAIAALLVVYFHAILQLQKLNPDAMLAGAVLGESGVDLFFVLSGFVMWITTSGKQISPTEFYARRIKRIVPLYWTVTLAAAIVALVAPTILRSTVFDFPHVLSSLLFVPWINPADPAGQMIAPVIVPGWTLNYEMYFYLLFGFMLVLPQSFRLFAMLATFIAVALICRLFPTGSTATLFYGNLVIFEFLAGAAIGRLYLAGHRLPLRLALALIVAAACLLLAFDHLHLPVDRMFKLGIPAAIIVYAATAADFSGMRTLPWLRYLGDASYSIYLTHIFVLAGARMLYWQLPFDLLRNEFVFLTASIMLSIIVGSVVHSFFEAPIDRFLNRRPPVKRAEGKAKVAAPAQ